MNVGEKGAVIVVAGGALALAALLGTPTGIGSDGGNGIMIAILMAAYFLPAVIASMRSHRNTAPILIVNAVFGWTLIGWVGCLAWAFMDQGTAAHEERN